MAELIKCAEREAALRRRVYPGWVARGKMTQEKAYHEALAMEEIARRLGDWAATFGERSPQDVIHMFNNQRNQT